MCIDCCTDLGDKDTNTARTRNLTRRSMLAGIGGTATAGLAACAPSRPSPPHPRSTPQASAAGADRRLELVLLGTQAGPPVAADRTGTSTALVVDGKVYVVDCGRAATTQYRRAGLDFADLAGIFITHLHADHVADYYNFFMLGGGTIPAIADGIGGPVPVYGPGPAGGLPDAFGGKEVPVTNPDQPTPGLKELTRRCTEAFAYSNNVLMRDSGFPDTSAMPVVHEIGIPDVGASYKHTSPACTPFKVMSDDRVHVTATLVPHGPVFPAFAYRFDTEYGSVTFSGDTMLSDNLVQLAHGSDVLIHEAVNLEGSSLPPVSRDHMLKSHVEVQKVGSVARRADVPKLVLSHIIDFKDRKVDPVKWKRFARRGYDGSVVVGHDLQRIGVR
ncbi:MBL fold metallo-hydrolase [Streptomyces sp. NPDC102364]|uniref:MBL fold metallo-hydrolase n=1 Tax=Streptomyces sp. NPDC102364 TaxID=3366161 RepID=UPI00382F496C